MNARQRRRYRRAIVRRSVLFERLLSAWRTGGDARALERSYYGRRWRRRSEPPNGAGWYATLRLNDPAYLSFGRLSR